MSHRCLGVRLRTDARQCAMQLKVGSEVMPKPETHVAAELVRATLMESCRDTQDKRTVCAQCVQNAAVAVPSPSCWLVADWRLQAAQTHSGASFRAPGWCCPQWPVACTHLAELIPNAGVLWPKGCAGCAPNRPPDWGVWPKPAGCGCPEPPFTPSCSTHTQLTVPGQQSLSLQMADRGTRSSGAGTQ